MNNYAINDMFETAYIFIDCDAGVRICLNQNPGGFPAVIYLNNKICNINKIVCFVNS